MSKDRLESILALIATLLLGVGLIAIGTAKQDQIWFTILMIVMGVVFIFNAGQYSERISQKRNH